jgi:glycosyltransferase involved in cell wall biosynthesis
MVMPISVIVPTYNSIKSLTILLDTLLNQDYSHYEIIVVDDCSTDDTSSIIKDYSVKYFKIEKNSGPAVCRNIGARISKGDVLAFTDSDCRVGNDWLRKINFHLSDDNVQAIMGKLIIDQSTYLGNSISALGFPAGGSLGFEKVWKVDNNSYTSSLSSCNCAIRKNVFNEIGGFDESFPYAGGEDSFFAYSLIQSEFKIKYCPDVIVKHQARNSLRDFLAWQFKRGISSCIFSSKVKNRSDFISMRLKTVFNVIKENIVDIKLPLIFLLLISGYLTQTLGFIYGKKRDIK